MCSCIWLAPPRLAFSSCLRGRPSTNYYIWFNKVVVVVVKVKPWSQGWLIAAGAYPGFCSIKRLEVFLLPLDGMLVHRRSLPRNFVRFPQPNSRYPFIHLGGERHCESKVSCPRTQHTVPGQGSNPDRSLRSRAH